MRMQVLCQLLASSLFDASLDVTCASVDAFSRSVISTSVQVLYHIRSTERQTRNLATQALG